ncbi:hypothetical protein NE237_011090 [Protea cynaroides]|uniref:Uncharacterized protein n=1 Tax=Protea cynaroides TaxID=273540 RepID=A0A9Q0GUA5_9MAGN|nr:hypothetical protein NE237_011090 [Protea cynaroides]
MIKHRREMKEKRSNASILKKSTSPKDFNLSAAVKLHCFRHGGGSGRCPFGTAATSFASNGSRPRRTIKPLRSSLQITTPITKFRYPLALTVWRTGSDIVSLPSSDSETTIEMQNGRFAA